jgi:hypothetical protein
MPREAWRTRLFKAAILSSYAFEGEAPELKGL